MTVNRTKKKRERGIVTFLTASSLVFMIFPFVGLAIDAGVAYMVKAKLQTAVDGAAIAAGRSLSRGIDLTAQKAEAEDTANRFFHANFPDHWMGVETVPNPVASYPTPTSPKTIILNFVGTVSAPTYFMRILGYNTIAVSAVGQVTRRDVNVILVLDRSGSLDLSESCEAVKTAAKSFVDSFVNGRDQLGMVTFGTDYRIDYPASVNFGSSPSLSTKLDTLNCYGYTNAAAAYWEGYQRIVALNDTGSLNVLIFFTDGMPNALTFGGANKLPVKKLTSPATTYTGLPSTSPSATYSRANKSNCLDSAGRNNTNALWAPSDFSGVISYLGGIYKKDATNYPITQALDSQLIGPLDGNNGGCAFNAQFNNPNTIYNHSGPTFAVAGPGFPAVYDVAYLPRQDINGNYLDSGPNGSGSPFKPVRKYTSGNYVNQIKIDEGFTSGNGYNNGVNDTLTNAGINALDNAAQRARADAATKNLALVVYAIGLGNAPGGVDNLLLARVANDPENSDLPANSSYNDGIYIYSPDATQLNQAFNQIASEVLRISK